MINHEEKSKKLIEELYEKNILHDPLVAEVFEKVPMQDFFPKEVWDFLYKDRPIPYSLKPQRPCAAPHMNAIFLHLINLDVDSKILQLSSMSGYFASLMTEISTQGRVTILEDNQVVSDITLSNIRKAKREDKISIINSDPMEEVSNHLNADRIIFCGAISNSFLREVADQVKDGTIILAPVFNSALFPVDQDLIRVIKEDGELITESFGKVNFILLESKKITQWTKKTQKLIFDQIANQLQDYFQQTYPNQEPILRLGVKTPEFISKELLDASSMLSQGLPKQVILNCLEILKQTIRYLYKKNIDENADFSKMDLDKMIEKLRDIEIINKYNNKNLITVLDTRQMLNYDPENPPNFEYIAKTTLNHLIWFIEYIFK
ncbi:MAG: hypothetical protein GF329_13060 [Candidatus Lokiarchaeota archaeon]|nr:hypothetical protein [Candidatus Lokiarchaeota archaeon]